MKRGDPWYKRCPRDIYDGTRQLSLEARGAYNDILDLIYMHAGPIPDDAGWMAHALHTSKRKWTSLRKVLLDAGKITIEAGQITNARAIFEIGSRKFQSQSNREIAVKRERKKREKTLNSNEIKEAPARTVHHARAFTDTDTDTDTESIATTVENEAARGTAAQPQKLDLKTLSERLLEACNGALDNPVNCMGLLSMAEPQMWLDQGCDLERDVLPTLAAAGKKYHGKRIRTWGYFTSMVTEAKQRRERGLPQIDIVAKTKKRKPLGRYTDLGGAF